MNDNSATIAGRAFPSEWVTCPAPFLESREKRVDRLLYGLFHHQRIQLLSGPAGAGKSIALRRLEKRLRDRLLTVCIDAADITDQRALLRQIGDATDSHFGEPGSARSDAASRVDAISRRLQQLADDGQRVVLLLDNAEQLDAASIGSLLELARTEQAPAAGALGVVLACLPEFTADHSDRRHWEPVPLQPLSLAGTGHYLQQRLCRAGIRGHGPFNRAVVENIHAQSGGWPGNIDQQARETLGNASHNLLHTEIRFGRTARIITVLLGLLIMAALAWWYQQPLRDLVTNATTTAAPAKTSSSAASTQTAAPSSLTAPSPQASSDIPDEPNDNSASSTTLPAAQPIGEPGNAPATTPESATETDSTETPSAAAEQTTPARQPNAPANSAAERTAEPPQASLPANTTPATETAAPAAQPKQAAPSVARGAILHLQSWIEQQPPKRWTLQVFTAHSESHVLNLVTRSGIAGDWAYYHLRQNDKDWYTLLYGSFSSRDAALKASPQLKSLFGDPLLRTYQGIHKSLGIDSSE